jgi:hypothetical protein
LGKELNSSPFRLGNKEQMMDRFLRNTLTLAGLLLLGTTAQAASVSGQGTWETTLQGRDLDGDNTTAEAWYDSVLGITWLGDANHAHTTGFDADGRMNWGTANAWAAGLDPYGSGITGWRLPTVTDTETPGCNDSLTGGFDCGYNVDTATGEMASMYYDTLGNLADFSTDGSYLQPGWGLSNTGPFENLQSYPYWSATEYAPNNFNAWGFNFDSGYQNYSSKAYGLYGWAVHAGDVGASVVPIPGAAWLFGSALLGLVGVGAKRRR